MKKIIYTVAFLISTFSFAQINGSNPGDAPLQIYTRSNAEIYKMEGSPYFEDEFAPGLLLVEDGKSIPGFFRYNVTEDKIEIKLRSDIDGDKTYFLPRLERYSYKLRDYTYEAGKYQTANNGVVEGYFMNYFDGENVKLLGKPVSKISLGQEAKTGYEKAKPSQIYINQVYYLQVNGGDLHEVRIKEKDFEEFLEDKPGMKAYFKDHKIKDIDDAKKLLSFYDQQA